MQRAFHAEAPPAAGSARVSGIVIFGVGATVATGLAVKAATGGLGTALPPFVSVWAPRLQPWAAVPALVFTAAAAIAPRASRRVRSPLAFAGGLFGLALVLGLALNLARGGVHGWYSIFDLGPHGSFEAQHEYLPGLPATSYGTHFFLDRFAELVPSLPVNVAGHPPGLLLSLHLLGIESAPGMAALCVGLGSLCAPLAYDLGRTLGGEERGRHAGLLTVFAPSLLLFGVTSADYLYAALGMVTACLLVRRSPAARLCGAGLVPLAAFFSWLLLAIPAWAALVVLQRDGPRRALALALTCGAALVAFNVVLAASVGYDPIGALRSTEQVYRHSLARVRPYGFWLFGSPTAWLVMLGLPTAWLVARAAAARDRAALALAAIVLVSAVAGFTKAETERIWLPFVPLACVAAAAGVERRHLPTIIWILASQALLSELLLYTIW
jgi:methylthioxylose transferase